MYVGSLQRICNAFLKGLKVHQNVECFLFPGSHRGKEYSELGREEGTHCSHPSGKHYIYSLSFGPEFTEIIEDAERRSS